MSNSSVVQWNQGYHELEKLLIGFFGSNPLDQNEELAILHEKMERQLIKLVEIHSIIHRSVIADRPGKSFPWMTTILDSLSGVMGSGVYFIGDDKSVNRWLAVGFFTLPFVYTLYKDAGHHREMKKVRHFFEFLEFVSKEQYILKELQKWNTMISHIHLNSQDKVRSSLPTKEFLFQRLPENVRKKINPALKFSRSVTTQFNLAQIITDLPADWEKWSTQRIFNAWYQNLQAIYAAFGAIGDITENRLTIDPSELNELIFRVEQLLEALKINYKHAQQSLSILPLKYGIGFLRYIIPPSIAFYIVFLIDFISTFLGVTLIACNVNTYAGITLGIVGIFSREIKGQIQLKKREPQIEDQALLEMMIHRGQDLLPHFAAVKEVMRAFVAFISAEHPPAQLPQKFLSIYNKIYDIGIPVKTCLSRTDLAKILIHKIVPYHKQFSQGFQNKLKGICNVVGYADRSIFDAERASSEKVTAPASPDAEELEEREVDSSNSAGHPALLSDADLAVDPAPDGASAGDVVIYLQ